MKCPACNAPRPLITTPDYIHDGKVLKRINTCRKCSFVFITYEMQDEHYKVMQAKITAHYNKWKTLRKRVAKLMETFNHID